MFPLVRTRRFAFAAVAVAVGVGVFGGLALLAASVFINNVNSGISKGDPDPQGNSIIAVCSDVPFHVWYTANIGTETRPDNRKFSEAVRGGTDHARNPFDKDGHRRCPQYGSAFGSRVDFKAPGLNDGQPFSVTALVDHKHFLVVRFTKNADGTVTGTQEPVGVPASP
ncbi:hypothetical protein [Actinoallomurus rhizosphaericola]|uniref:hypothetical protein n=1 Tax=Actinoallomurus rhizosphaericola TaxID=2952536 RepID=UPI0020916268|nr:hypothetical protein [Actinoallomurus rhizosphaericola]MCO5992011.1 hypothetical protein [Actinoallomurus rhizosphaericola]